MVTLTQLQEHYHSEALCEVSIIKSESRWAPRHEPISRLVYVALGTNERITKLSGRDGRKYYDQACKGSSKVKIKKEIFELLWVFSLLISEKYP